MLLRRVLAVAIASAVAGCGGGNGAAQRAGPPPPQLNEQVARALQERLEAKVDETGIPGASAAIVFPDGREWAGAAGQAVLEPPRPMTTDSALPFDSVTKLAVAALAMRLVEQGRLRLDDPIHRWYPSWRGDRRATVRDLLAHTAGARDPTDQVLIRAYRRHGERMTARVIDAAPTPGVRSSEAEYSNQGFLIAGAIVARAAGEPLATAMRREVFSHLGGDGLALQPDERPSSPLAHAYSHPDGFADAEDLSDGSPYTPARELAAITGAAGALAGDVPSLARWAHRLLGGRILAPASLREMSRFRRGAFWEAYGLGLARDSIDGRTMIGHGGDGFGSHTELWHLTRETLTIALTWNEDLLDREGDILPALLRIALR